MRSVTQSFLPTADSLSQGATSDRASALPETQKKHHWAGDSLLSQHRLLNTSKFYNFNIKMFILFLPSSYHKLSIQLFSLLVCSFNLGVMAVPVIMLADKYFLDNLHILYNLFHQKHQFVGKNDKNILKQIPVSNKILLRQHALGNSFNLVGIQAQKQKQTGCI